MHETIDTDNLTAHEFANLFPMITGKQFDELVASIADPAIGMIEPIITFEGKILDGRHRYAAAKAARVELDPEFHFKQFKGTEAEALAYVTAINLKRRHLSSSQRAMAAAVIATLEQGSRGHCRTDSAVTVQQAGEALGVSAFLVKAAKRVRRNAAPHICSMVEAGPLASLQQRPWPVCPQPGKQD